MLQACDRYLEAAPCLGADVEDIGGWRLFRSHGAFPYYARPRVGGPPVAAGDLAAVTARMQELGLPREIEWVRDLREDVEPLLLAAGWTVSIVPLLVLGANGLLAPTRPMPDGVADGLIEPTRPMPEGVAVSLVDGDDPLLPSVRAVSQVAFASPGTAAGEAGADAVDAVLSAADDAVRAGDEHVRRRMRAGLMRAAAAIDRHGRVLASGYHQPARVTTDDGSELLASEIVGIGTVPAARRQGLGAAVTARLAQDALDLGAQLVLLTAGDDDVARLYESLGFVRLGACGAATLPA